MFVGGSGHLTGKLEAATGGVLYKKVFWKFRKIHRKIPVPEFLFL